MARAELPATTWVVPLLALLILPPLGSGPLGARLSVLAAELLLALPAWIATPPGLRPAVLPWAHLSRGWWMALALLPPAAAMFQRLAAGWDRLLPADPAAREALRHLMTPSGPLDAALLFLSLLVVAPVAEEVFFRGLVPWLWRRQLGARGALWGPALLFALAHGSLRQLPSLFLLGGALGWLARRSGSLLPGMLLHFGVNLAGWLALRGVLPGLDP